MKILLRKSDAQSPFSFIFTDDNDKTLIKSENYTQKASASNGIESVKKNLQIDARYEFKEAKNKKLFFNIKSTNGQIVGTSAFFDTNEQMQDAINYLKQNAQNTQVQE